MAHLFSLSLRRRTLHVAALVAVLILAGCGAQPGPPPKLVAEYYAVLLSNGQVYFGRLEGLGTTFPILKEVYYVQTGVNNETKQQQSILLKRGGEWHAPDQMILNASQVVLVEPVGKDSRVSQLIAELRRK